MCILCGNHVNLFECVFDFSDRENDGICVVPLASATNTTSEATFQPFVTILLVSGWYFMILLSRVSVAILLLQYMNSINCIVISGAGFSSGGRV